AREAPSAADAARRVRAGARGRLAGRDAQPRRHRRGGGGADRLCGHGGGGGRRDPRADGRGAGGARRRRPALDQGAAAALPGRGRRADRRDREGRAGRLRRRGRHEQEGSMPATAPWDVVVVGAGPGGCATAIEAARGGARVVLLEAGQDVGGNAARSTGYLAFAGTAMQRAAGIADDAERFLADMRAEIARQEERYGLVFDEALARVVAEESADAHDFLVALGFRFNRFIPRPRQHTVDRMVDVADVAMFRDLFGAELERLGVDVRLRTRAVRLVVDG